jgi:hypothetical protein
MRGDDVGPLLEQKPGDRRDDPRPIRAGDQQASGTATGQSYFFLLGVPVELEPVVVFAPVPSTLEPVVEVLVVAVVV